MPKQFFLTTFILDQCSFSAIRDILWGVFCSSLILIFFFSIFFHLWAKYFIFLFGAISRLARKQSLRRVSQPKRIIWWGFLPPLLWAFFNQQLGPVTVYLHPMTTPFLLANFALINISYHLKLFQIFFCLGENKKSKNNFLLFDVPSVMQKG